MWNSPAQTEMGGFDKVTDSLRRVPLLFRTARHLTLAQIGFRGRRIIKRQWRQLRGSQAPQPTDWKQASYVSIYKGLAEVAGCGALSASVSGAVRSAEGVAANRFCFLNNAVDFGAEPDWRRATLSPLWRYHLHYFDYIRELLIWAATRQRSNAYSAFRSLANSWINRNQIIAGDGWHAYTISLRVVNWLHAASGFEAELSADQPFRERLLSSLYGQSQILFGDLELDLRGNHLLENLRALLWTGAAFDGDEPGCWFRKALTLLERELAEQILPDGGHFERSPGYHLVVLKDCLEIGLWLRRNRKDSPRWLDDALRRMLDYTIKMFPPSWRAPLLKDTAWDAAPVAEDLLAAAAAYFDEPAYKRCGEFGLYPFLLFGLDAKEKFDRWPLNDAKRDSGEFRDSGHYVLRDDAAGEYLIFDAGKPCPDYLPAHAHADLLSYELSIDGERVVVDSGVYEYTEGDWRDYFRSTLAHNTIEVEGEDQSEMWSNFRVARRAQPGPVTWRQGEEYVMVQGEHDGYRRLDVPVTHRRTVVWRKGRFWLIVDELLGSGHTKAASHIHFHPKLSLGQEEDSLWRIQSARSPLWIRAFGHRSHSIARGQMEPVRQGWYSERFGQINPNTVFTMHQQSRLPILLGYVISRDEPAQVQTGEDEAGLQIILSHQDQRHTLRLAKHAAPRFE